MIRRAPEDDLEVLPVDLAPLEPPPVAGDDAPRRRRRPMALVAAVVVAAVIALVAETRPDRADPAADSQRLVDAWARTLAINDVANHDAVHARILVPIRDTTTLFRGLAAVRAEERVRLDRLAASVERVDGRDVDVDRARDAIARALDVRERRAGLAAEFYARVGEGIRNFEAVERAIVETSRDVTDALGRLRRRFPLRNTTPQPPSSTALRRALGDLAMLTKEPVGARLLVDLDGVLYELDPDRGANGRVTRHLEPPVRGLVTMPDGTVVRWDANGEVRTQPNGEVIGHGRPFVSHRGESLWLTTGDVVTEVSLDGVTLNGPFRLPAPREIVGVVSTGLVVALDPPAVGVWAPRDGTVQPLTGGNVVAARGDDVATTTCGPERCLLRVTDVATGAAREAGVAHPHAWMPDTTGAFSPDGQWLAATTARGLALVDLTTFEVTTVPTSPDEVPRDLTWDPRRSRVFMLFERSSVGAWVDVDDPELHRIRFAVAFDRVTRVRNLAVAP